MIPLNPKVVVVAIALSIASGAAAMAWIGSTRGRDLARGGESSGAGAAGSEMPEMEMGMGGMAMEETAAAGAIRLSSGEISTFGITFGSAEVRPLSKTIRVAGYIDFDETRMMSVAPRFGGWVEDLHVNFTGQAVTVGEPLLEVYSPELVAVQEELLLAARMAAALDSSRVEEAAAGARELLASARRRLQYWEISDEQIEEILKAGEVRRTLTIHAPAAGIVTQKDVILGERFEPGRNLYVIADLSRVWVNAEIFEADASLIREGMPAEITVAARPGEFLRGRVEYVYPTLSDRTRSMRARVTVPNPGGELKPGMYATATLTAAMGETLTVPASSVLHTGERAVAFVDLGGGRLMPQELHLGVVGEGYVQVLSGVEPGQRVVTSPQFLLDSESNLAEVMQAMMAQMNLSDMGAMDMPGMEMGDTPMPGMEE